MKAASSCSLAEAEFALLRLHALTAGTVIERNGRSLLAFGRARTFRLPLGLTDPGALEAIVDELARLSPPAGGGYPLAVGALSFLPDAPGELVLPSLSLTAEEGAYCAVAVGEDARVAVDRLLAEATSPSDEEEGELPPDSFRLVSARSHADFLERVRRAVSEVRSGRLDKVVLAREVVIEANRPLRRDDLFERLRSLHPSCTTFSVEGFVGATPELLIRRSGREVCSEPLAGTAPRSGDPLTDRKMEEQLFSSEKERAEHDAVVTAIASGLAPLTSLLEVPPEPEIIELRNVSHLRTRIRGELARGDDGSFPSVLEALALIHPTPAVAGSPVETALEYLAKEEELDRGPYAGPVGFVRADGDGEFHLGIRCARVDGSRARLYAGVGIVSDSDPLMELRETQLKLQAVLAAAVRP